MSMGGVKILVVFAMAALCLAVVPRRVRLDELVAYATLLAARLKQCGSRIIGIAESFCKLIAIIHLYIFHIKWKFFKHRLEKDWRAVCAVFFESL